MHTAACDYRKRRRIGTKNNLKTSKIPKLAPRQLCIPRHHLNTASLFNWLFTFYSTLSLSLSLFLSLFSRLSSGDWKRSFSKCRILRNEHTRIRATEMQIADIANDSLQFIDEASQLEELELQKTKLVICPYITRFIFPLIFWSAILSKPLWGDLQRLTFALLFIPFYSLAFFHSFFLFLRARSRVPLSRCSFSLLVSASR